MQPAWTIPAPFTATADGALLWQAHGQTLRIEAWGDDAVRVRAILGDAVRDDLPHALLPGGSQPAVVRIADDHDHAELMHGRLRVRVNKGGAVSWLNADGSELLAETHDRYPRWPGRMLTPAAGGLTRIELRLKAYDGERLWGLGQHQHGRFDNKGQVIELCPRNAEVPIPFAVSSRGYGFLWNNPGLGRVEPSLERTRWLAEGSVQMDCWVVAGGTPAACLQAYMRATGLPPRFPDWALGFWQSKLLYRNQDELLAVAREYRRRGYPLAVIVSDFFHWPAMGEFDFDRKDWPDPAAMTAELRSLGVELAVSVWPSLNPKHWSFQHCEERGWLLRRHDGGIQGHPFHDGGARTQISYYDATHPEARAWLWSRMQASYRSYGVRAFWLDCCEPETPWFQHQDWRLHAGPGIAVGNLYAIRHQQGFHDGLRAAGEEVLTLCRSAWAGSARYGCCLWSGDIDSDWRTFGQQLRAGLNAAMSGIPWWNTDIGGFQDGRIDDPDFRELLVRWFQFGTFSPLMRLHGVREPKRWGGPYAPNEVWSYGPEVEALLAPWLFVRERLKPYLRRILDEASRTGLPPLRPLILMTPEDAAAADADDQFLLGPDLLVAPVAVAGARRRSVYLPTGSRWRCVWSGAVHDGGQRLDAEAPLERLPLFVREEAAEAAAITAAIRG